MNATQPETDRAYVRWLGKNRSGFVANVTKSLTKSYYVIHMSECPSITPGSSRSSRPGAFTERAYRKVVGNALESIIDWGHSNGFSLSARRACQRCLKGVKLPVPTSPAAGADRRSRPFDATQPPKPFARGSHPASPEETLALLEKASKSHYDLLVALSRTLKAANWTSIEEIPVAIDLWAKAPERRQRVIFEAKTLGNEIQQTRAALAQLLEYRHVYGAPSDRLCLVVNRRLSVARERFLEAMDIAILWQDGKKFRSASSASPTWVSSLVSRR